MIQTRNMKIRENRKIRENNDMWPKQYSNNQSKIGHKHEKNRVTIADLNSDLREFGEVFEG